MRRTALSLILGLVAMALVPAPAAAMSVGQPRTYAVDHLEADWVYPSKNGDRLRWYLIDAQVVVDRDSGEIVASDAFGGVGWCTDDGSSCGMRPKSLRVVDYYSDPLLQTATLTLRGQGGYHRVHFFATTEYWGASEARVRACKGARLGYSLRPRNADASGTVFGQTVDTMSEFDPDAESVQRTVVVCP